MISDDFLLFFMFDCLPVDAVWDVIVVWSAFHTRHMGTA